METTKSFNWSRILIILSLLLVIILASACDKRSIDPNRIRVTDFFMSDSVLYEDNGQTFITAYVQVRDNNQFPVYGQRINFKSGVEQVRFNPSSAVSDSSGIATTIIYISGKALLPGQNERLTSIGAYIGTNLQLEIPVKIMDKPAVETIIFEPEIIPASKLNQNRTLRARPFDVNDRPIADGTIVTFYTTRGHFIRSGSNEIVENQISVSVRDGVAQATYNTGTVSGPAEVYAKSSGVESTRRNFIIQPGSPRYISLTPEKSAVLINGETIKVTAELTDQYTNVIGNKAMTFNTSLGSITATVNTDENGIAEAFFTPGSEAGNAQISAAADSANASIMININSSDVQSMSFTNQNSISLNVQGSGGVESQTIGVRLFDMSNNVVTESKRVLFTKVSAPLGVTMGNNPTHVDTVIATSYGGVANVSISAGTVSGIVVLRAQLLDDDDMPVFPEIIVERANIIIHAGPPHTAQILMPNEDSGTSVGAGAWEMVVAVKVNDRWGNPVRRGLGVSFSLPNSAALADSIAINPTAFVGNVSAEGDSANGHAYTTLVYHGRLSNRLIDIKAEITNTIEANATIKLPMNRIRLDVAAVPPYIEWYFNGPPPAQVAEKSTEIRVSVKDGQNNPIQYAPLTFYSTRGYFKDTETNPILPPAENPTDPGDTPHDAITNREGFQYKRFYASGYIAPPSDNPPMETSATVTVHVIGFENVMRSVEIALRIWWPA